MKLLVIAPTISHARDWIAEHSLARPYVIPVASAEHLPRGARRWPYVWAGPRDHFRPDVQTRIIEAIAYADAYEIPADQISAWIALFKKLR